MIEWRNMRRMSRYLPRALFIGILLLEMGCAGAPVASSDNSDVAPLGGDGEPHYASQLLLEETRAVLPEGVTPRHVNQQGLDMTAAFEGFRSKLYADAAGHCTIGYGHLLKLGACDDALKKQYEKGLTRADAKILLGKDMNRAEIAVQLAATGTLTDGQFAAVCDFAFNCGTGALKKSGIMPLLNQGKVEQAAAKMKLYVKAGGRVLQALVQRRDAEVALLMEGLTGTRAVLPEIDPSEYRDILSP